MTGGNPTRDPVGFFLDMDARVDEALRRQLPRRLWSQFLDPITASVGDVKMTASTLAHPGWLVCNGQAVSRATYPALFTAIGTFSGAGDGTTTFNLPNIAGPTAALIYLIKV